MSPTLLLLYLAWLTLEQETSCPEGDNSFVVLICALGHWLVIHQGEIKGGTGFQKLEHDNTTEAGVL